MKTGFEKIGTAGAIVAALFCPICFPKIALIGAIFGFGALVPFEGWFAAAAQVFLIVALIGHLVAFRQHRNPWVFALATLSVAFVIGPLWIRYVEWLVYLGLLGMVTATIWSAMLLRKRAFHDAATEATYSAPDPAVNLDAPRLRLHKPQQEARP